MELFKKKEDQPAPPPAGGAEQPHGLGGMFASKPAPPIGAGGPDVAKDVTTLMRRVRINEERNVNQRKKLQMIEHNMLLHQKKLLEEIRFMNDEIATVKREFLELKNSIHGFSRELQEAAKKQDLEVLERYVNMWEPVKFVTQKEVDRIVEEKLKEMRE